MGKQRQVRWLGTWSGPTLLGLIVAAAASAGAAEPPAESRTEQAQVAPVPPPQVAEEAKPGPKTEQKAEPKPDAKPEPKPELKSDAAAATRRFVDRDGDGIQDGQEHRFRRKRGTRSDERDSGEQQRQRLRRGAQDGSGGHGPGPSGRSF